MTTLSKIIQHTDETIQIKFSLTSRYSFTQEFLSTRPSISSTNLNSVNFAQNILIPIPIYQQQESLDMSPTHSYVCPSQVNIIHKKTSTIIQFLFHLSIFQG